MTFSHTFHKVIQNYWNLFHANAHYVLFVSALLLILSFKASLTWPSNLRKRLYFTKLIPQIRMVPILSYWSLYNTVCKDKKEAPYMYYVFQYICGYCKIHEKRGIAAQWLWLRPIILLSKAEAAEGILNNSSTIDKAKEYNFLRPWLGDGLLTSTGTKWRNRRKLLTSSFHFRILDDFMPIYNEQSQIFVKKVKNLGSMKAIDVVPLMTACTLDIICETTMGVRINAQHDESHEYVQAIYEVGNTLIGRVIRPWLWLDWCFYLSPSGRKFYKNIQILHNFTRKVIKEKKSALLSQMNENTIVDEYKKSSESSNQKKPKALLELLLIHQIQNDLSLTEEDIGEEVDTFMFEGHDTTTIGISWALYNIGLYQDVQEKIMNELVDIFGDDKERSITAEDIKSMKYLDRVLKESLRLYPPVPFFGREIKEDIDIHGYKIAAGSACLIIPFMVHRDPEMYPNPENFDPDRFLPENVAKMHAYAYIPFSAGPRNCIGQKFAMMEEKTVIANILRNFRIKSVDQKDKILLTGEVVLRNLSPLNVQFIPR